VFPLVLLLNRLLLALDVLARRLLLVLLLFLLQRRRTAAALENPAQFVPSCRAGSGSRALA
jgi:hypothetical protein